MIEKNPDKYINLVWLVQCKTGFTTISRIFDMLFPNPKIYSHSYKTWKTDKYIIHKVYYTGKDIKTIIKKIKNPQYLITIRDPIKRFLSCYNFCLKNKWINMDILEYNDYYNKDSLELYLSKFSGNKLTRFERLGCEHSRTQFEYLEFFGIAIKDIKYLLRTDNLSIDIKVLLKKLFNIDYNLNIIENQNLDYKINEYNMVNKTLEKELEIYNQFDLSKAPIMYTNKYLDNLV